MVKEIGGEKWGNGFGSRGGGWIEVRRRKLEKVARKWEVSHPISSRMDP